MKTAMKLTIITVNLNNRVGLEKTINSVIGQNYPDFEYIIIDGNSTDGSVDLIKQETPNFQNKRFNWLSEPDNGVYQAMNKGIRMARGEYLLFLNSGDFLFEPNVLSVVFGEDHNAGILYGKSAQTLNSQLVHTTNPPVELTFGTLLTEGLSHQATFIKKQLFVTFGLYREDFRYNSDIDFWFKAIIAGNTTTEKLDQTICYYDLGGISSTESNSLQYKNELNTIFSQLNFNRFIPDYDNFARYRASNELFDWIKRKKALYKFNYTLYRIAKYLTAK